MKTLLVVLVLALTLGLAGCTGWDKKGSRTGCESDWISHDASPSFNQGDMAASWDAGRTCVVEAR